MKGEATLNELIRKFGQRRPCVVATVYAQAGNIDESFAWLDRAMEQRDTNVAWLKTGWELKPLRQDPRWGALLRRIHLDEP